jgi:O-antigen/teichoic acid export membrane protein
MFRSLLGNALVSAVAFAIVGIVGLLLVPVLVGAYGVAGLGLIMVARLFLPGVGIGVFDFGISEIATQTLAVSRVDQNWSRAHRRLGQLARMTLAIAVLVAIPLAVWAPELASAFAVPSAEKTDFVEVLRCTSALLPTLFLSLMIEGGLKGFEGFRALRLAEVTSTIAYAATATVVAWSGAGYKWIIYAHLGSLVLRAALLTAFLSTASPFPVRLLLRPEPEDRTFLYQRATVFFTSRFFGTVLHQSPTVLIGVLIGPFGVGLYDALARLPRFAKSVLGVLNTTLLPYATRLDAAGDDGRMKLLLVFGLTLLPALVFPPVAAVASVSGGLLSLWIGPAFGAHGPWLALFWVLPALNAIVSFQNYVLMSRTSYLQASNRLTLVQIVVQVVISLALLDTLSQHAFIAGYVGSSVLLFAWQLSLIHKEVELPRQNVGRLITYGVALAGFVAVFYLVARDVVPVSWLGLAGVCLMLWGLLAALTYALFLGRAEREMLRAIVTMLRQRKKNEMSSAKD